MYIQGELNSGYILHKLWASIEFTINQIDFFSIQLPDRI